MWHGIKNKCKFNYKVSLSTTRLRSNEIHSLWNLQVNNEDSTLSDVTIVMRVPCDKTFCVRQRGRTRIIPDSDFLSAVRTIRKPTRSFFLSFFSGTRLPRRRSSFRFEESHFAKWRDIDRFSREVAINCRRSADDSSHPRTSELINASRETELQCRYCAQLIREVLKEESEELYAIRGSPSRD